MGIEGDVLRHVLRNYIVHIKGRAIFGVPASEIVTRTGRIRDGIRIVCFQIVCLGLSDFFGPINRHHSVVGQVAIVVVQFAAIGIKGHLAEAKKFVSCQFSMASKPLICGGLVIVVVDDTSIRTTFQTVSERSQSSREHNIFQLFAIGKGTKSNGCYFFRDGDVLQ